MLWKRCFYVRGIVRRKHTHTHTSFHNSIYFFNLNFSIKIVHLKEIIALI